MPRTVATQNVPSRAASFGSNLGRSLGGGGFMEGVMNELNAQKEAEQLNPTRLSILQKLNEIETLTPSQTAIREAAREPRQFRDLVKDPRNLQSIAAISELLKAPKREPQKFIRVVNSEQGKRLGLGIPEGEHARVEFTMDPETNRQVAPPSVLSRFVTREGGTGSGDAPSFFDNDNLQNITMMASRFAQNALSPEEERAFLLSVYDYRQPERDPDTGLINRRPELPDFVRDAFRHRGMSIPGLDGPAPARSESESTARLAQMGGGDPAQALTEQAAATQQTPTIPRDAVIPTWGGGRTVADEVLAGNVTGPAPELARGLSRLPGLGIDFPEQVSAKQMVPLLRDRIVKALQTNPRYATSERQSIIENLMLDPGLIDTPQNFMDRLISMDRTLEIIEGEMEAVVGGQRTRVSGETRQHAMDTLQTIRHYRDYWLPTRIESKAARDRFIEQAAPGTRFTAKDDQGRWRIWKVQGEEE